MDVKGLDPDAGLLWKKMDKKITQLEDEKITKLYNKAYGDPEEMTKDSELTEEMFAASAVHEEEDKW